MANFIWAGQLIWLSLTCLYLLGLLSFSHPSYGLILLLVSLGIVLLSLYRVLIKSNTRQYLFWLFMPFMLAVGLFLPVYWFLGLGQPWHDQWVWPVKDQSAWQCVFQNKPSLGEGDFRYIVGLPLGEVGMLVLEEYDLSFAWVTTAQTEPQQIAANVLIDQEQLGPYFNQAIWYRLGQRLGLAVDAKPTACDFSQVKKISKRSTP